MDGRDMARITRVSSTLRKRDNERQAAKDILVSWMRQNMGDAGRSAIGEADRLLQSDYNFHRGLCEAYHNTVEAGQPLENRQLAELKVLVKAYLTASKAYWKKHEQLKDCVYGCLEKTSQNGSYSRMAVRKAIDLIPACMLRFNLYETLYEMEGRENG